MANNRSDNPVWKQVVAGVIVGVILLVLVPYLKDAFPGDPEGTEGSGPGASTTTDPELGSSNPDGPEGVTASEGSSMLPGGSGSPSSEPSKAKNPLVGAAAPPTLSLDGAVREYYQAVDRGDWAYTYDNLDAGSRANITQEEWRKKNRWFSDENPYSLTYTGMDADPSSSQGYDVTVYRESGDGFCSVRDTHFVREGDSWKHRLSEDELEALMPGVTYKRFVAAWQEDPPGGGLSSKDVVAEIEYAIRGHYEARGRAHFDEAYCYFGPRYRASVPQRVWVNDQESYDVQGVTIHSVEVRKISPDTATAAVRVTFDDDTGSRDFRVEWGLREIYGQWKLDREF